MTDGIGAYVTHWLRPDSDGEVAVKVCDLCSSLVMETVIHDRWHASLSATSGDYGPDHGKEIR